MATGELQASVDKIIPVLKKNPDASMAEIKQAVPRGTRVYPLAVGKAKVALGMGRKKKAKRRGRKKATRRGPGRPPKAASRRRPGRPRASTDPSALLGDIVNRMRDLERENERLRKAMDRIADLAGGA